MRVRRPRRPSTAIIIALLTTFLGVIPLVVHAQESTADPDPYSFVEATFGTSGGSLSTGTVTNPTNIVTTAITVPGEGYVSIEEADPTGEAPADFVLYGQTIDITAPPASADDPLLRITEIPHCRSAKSSSRRSGVKGLA